MKYFYYKHKYFSILNMQVKIKISITNKNITHLFYLFQMDNIFNFYNSSFNFFKL